MRVIVLQQHGDHVGGKLVGPCEEAVTEALFFIVTQDDNGLLVEFFGDQFLDLFLKSFGG